MSEVKRYDLHVVDRHSADGEGEIVTMASIQEKTRGNFVRLSDFSTLECKYNNQVESIRQYQDELDAQRLRADTAEAEVARLEDEFDTLENTNTTIKLKLSAAEQRIASHESTLRHFANCADVRQVGTAAMAYVAALNPNPEAESHDHD